MSSIWDTPINLLRTRRVLLAVGILMIPAGFGLAILDFEYNLLHGNTILIAVPLIVCLGDLIIAMSAHRTGFRILAGCSSACACFMTALTAWVLATGTPGDCTAFACMWIFVWCGSPVLLLTLATLACACLDLRRTSPWASNATPNHCSACGYNLTGNMSGICPECGLGVTSVAE